MEDPHPVQADTVAQGMRPPQFGEAAGGDDGDSDSSGAGAALRALDNALAGTDDELDVRDDAALPPLSSSSSRKTSASVAVSVRRREAVVNVPHERLDRAPGEENTRTCYHSGKTADALCVHVPFCVRHNSIVYMSDTLRCALYSNKQGKLGTLSMGRCVELERDVEALGEIEQVEHKPTSWLEGVEKEGNVLWFEGDTVFVRMTAKCKSVTHFADRIFMLHHVLQHPERYGMGGVSNVVVAADEDVAKKIRYSKSWHHGLLKAIVHPNKILYSHKTIRELVTSVPSAPGEMRVFVPSDIWDLAKGRLVPCFRRAAVPGSVRSQFFLSEDLFPGVVEPNAETSATRFHDADVFRTMMFQSLGHDSPPKVKKEILYLHRATTRTFTDSGLDTVEAKLREIAAASGFAYRFLDVAGMTFPQQIEAVAGAGVVVGIHGTQMLNTLFLPAGSSILEIFPFGFSNKLFQGGSGAGLHYAEYHLLQGEKFPQLAEFHGLENCIHVNKECRAWYQSDNRKLNFGLLDAAAAGNLVQQAIAHVQMSL